MTIQINKINFKSVENAKSQTTSNNTAVFCKVSFSTSPLRFLAKLHELVHFTCSFVIVFYLFSKLIHCINLSYERETGNLKPLSEEQDVPKNGLCQYEGCRKPSRLFYMSSSIHGIQICKSCYGYESKNGYLVPGGTTVIFIFSQHQTENIYRALTFRIKGPW